MSGGGARLFAGLGALAAAVLAAGLVVADAHGEAARAERRARELAEAAQKAERPAGEGGRLEAEAAAMIARLDGDLLTGQGGRPVPAEEAARRAGEVFARRGLRAVVAEIGEAETPWEELPQARRHRWRVALEPADFAKIGVAIAEFENSLPFARIETLRIAAAREDPARQTCEFTFSALIRE